LLKIPFLCWLQRAASFSPLLPAYGFWGDNHQVVGTYVTKFPAARATSKTAGLALLFAVPAMYSAQHTPRFQDVIIPAMLAFLISGVILSYQL